MKKILTAAIVILLFLAILGLVLLKVFAPAPVKTPSPSTGALLPTDTGTLSGNSAQAAAIKNSLAEQISNPSQITLDNAKVVYPYAIQDWHDENKGGEALLKYDEQQQSWKLITLGGGAWDVPSLVATGVPQDIAEKLMGS